VGGSRFRVAVVLTDEHRGYSPELREIERLVEGADVRRAVAEESDGDARLAAQLEGECRADGRRQSSAHNRVGTEVAPLDVVEMHRAPIAMAAALDLAVELRHYLVRVRPLRKGVTVGPVRRSDHVAVFQCPANADRDSLLPDGDVEEAGQLAGAKALLDLLLETANEEHLAQEILQTVGRCRLLAFLQPGHAPKASTQA
jgi:hypothetical protein